MLLTVIFLTILDSSSPEMSLWNLWSVSLSVVSFLNLVSLFFFLPIMPIMLIVVSVFWELEMDWMSAICSGMYLNKLKAS